MFDYYRTKKGVTIRHTFIFFTKCGILYVTKRRATNVSMALGSSLKILEMDKPNVLRCTRPYPLGFFLT